ncbi:rhamnose-binding lectin-like [Oreochromis aureus]|uniref:rhamnose-binding lectin-like n=1 Tax=Oreochromis aureus TaxID=47969 RepID=UPI001953E2CA|nr:rhamnose-binding lectin-like [Oreochromis aureus]
MRGRLTQAKRFVPSTATAISTNRVITCDGHLVQHLGCGLSLISAFVSYCVKQSGVIVVESVEYRCGQQEQSSQHDKLKVIKKSCDGKKTCDIDIQIFGTPDPGTCKYLDTTFACFPAVHSTACEGSTANLRCDEGEVSVVYWADYGRRDTTTCSQSRPTHEIQNSQCPNPTTKVADSCNGKSSCTIEASNSVFGDPCPGTYKYLDVVYDCELHTVACEGSQANLHCDDGHVIAVHWANYGRRDTSTCSYQRPECEVQNAQCANPTSKVADSCNGKSSCTIEASNTEFGDPCPGTYKYLEVAYDCPFHSITCEHSYANLHCDEGHVIVILSAEYGCNDSTTCSYKRPPAQPKNTQCSISTSKVAESCSIKVSNSVFGDPCPGTYKYLDVVYDCEYVMEEEHQSHQ